MRVLSTNTRLFVIILKIQRFWRYVQTEDSIVLQLNAFTLIYATKTNSCTVSLFFKEEKRFLFWCFEVSNQENWAKNKLNSSFQLLSIRICDNKIKLAVPEESTGGGYCVPALLMHRQPVNIVKLCPLSRDSVLTQRVFARYFFSKSVWCDRRVAAPRCPSSWLHLFPDLSSWKASEEVIPCLSRSPVVSEICCFTQFGCGPSNRSINRVPGNTMNEDARQLLLQSRPDEITAFICIFKCFDGVVGCGEVHFHS